MQSPCIAMPLARGRLVNGHGLHSTPLLLPMSPGHTMPHHTPETCVVLCHQFRHGGHGPLPRQGHPKGFKHQRKTAPRSRPGHVDPFGYAQGSRCRTWCCGHCTLGTRALR